MHNLFFQGSDDEYSDDDDMSWKVRRAAAKCLDAVVSTRHEMLPEFYKTVSPALIARFKEREENVKADVFHAYLSLLKQTRPVQSWLCDPDAMEQGETPLTMLQSQVICQDFCYLPEDTLKFCLVHKDGS